MHGMTATTTAVESLDAYRRRIEELATLVSGKRIRWIGSNSDGLQRPFMGRIKKLALLTGVGCVWEIQDVTEFFGGEPVSTHSYATIQCLTPIQLPESLAEVLDIPHIKAQVFLAPSVEAA